MVLLLAFSACKHDTATSSDVTPVAVTQSTTKTVLDSVAKSTEKDTSAQKAVKKVVTPQKPKPVVKKSKIVPSKARRKKNRPVPPKPKPISKIKFDKTLYNFGEITEGDIVEFTYTFTNVGNAPLEIIGADPSCGCARPEVPFLGILPGEKSQITVNYNSVSKSGVQHPEVIIKTNGVPTYTALKLTGTVLPKEKKKEAVDSVKASTKKDTLN